MKRKITAALLASALMMGQAAFAYSDITDPELSDAAETLSALGVIDGVGGGLFAPDEYLSREQFAKIAVCILGEKEKAVSGFSATAFTDVEADSWARGYISYVAENGIIAGFPDGTFGGKQILTYAQAVTVLLRCLGYKDSDVGFYWPEDYTAKAESLGISEGVSLKAGDFVTRGDAAKLCRNALFTKCADGEELVAKMKIKSYNDAVIYGSGGSGEIVTSKGTYKMTADSLGVEEAEGRKGRLLLNEDEEIVIFIPEEKNSKRIVVKSGVLNETNRSLDIIYDGGSVSLDYGTAIYCDGQKTTAEESLKLASAGSVLNLYYNEDGTIESGVLTRGLLIGPKTVTGSREDIYTLFDIGEKPNVIRKGVSAKFEDISRFDVLYYEEETNTIYAYCDKVSGIYEKAAPSKTNVETVTVSGKEYALSSGEAIAKLNESGGAFAIGDYVTLLLDRNGRAADAVDMTAAYMSPMGIVLDTYKRVNTDGAQEYAAKIFMTDGTVMEYAVDREYSDINGVPVKIKFENSVAKLSRVNLKSEGGAVNREMMTFGDRYLSSDCSIIELIENEPGKPAEVKKINYSDIGGSYLSSNQVIHVETAGDMNDVALLYVKDVTKSGYEYAIVTKIEKDVRVSEDGSEKKVLTGVYEVLLHGEKKTINVGTNLRLSEVIGIKGSDYISAVNMGSGSKITALDGERIKVGTKVYKAAPDFDIYRKTGINKYTLVSKDNILKEEMGSVTLYGDGTASNGGKVRVVIIE